MADEYVNGGIPLNDYKRFKFIDSRGNPYYWPKDKKKPDEYRP